MDPSSSASSSSSPVTGGLVTFGGSGGIDSTAQLGALQRMIDEQSQKSDAQAAKMEKKMDTQAALLAKVEAHRQAVDQRIQSVEQTIQEVRDDCRRQVQELEGRLRQQRLEDDHSEGDSTVGGVLNATLGKHPAPRAADRGKVPTFDGRSCSWEAYMAQFELVAERGGWDDAEKASQLATALRGNAMTTLANLTVAQRHCYTEIVRALEQRFGAGGQPELAMSKLRSRMQRRDEKLPELAEELERLVRLAYPDAGEETLSRLAKEQFVVSLRDDDLRQQVMLHRPRTLQEALQDALQVESVLASRPLPKHTVRVAATSEEDEEVTCETVKPQKVKGDKFSETVLGLLRDIQKSVANRPRFSRGMSQTRERMKCWNCGEVGHLQAG